jgi:hypothetical protein
LSALSRSLGRLRNLSDELRRDAPLAERLVHVGDRLTNALHLAPHVRVSRRIVFEITAAPPQFRGMRDLVVRRGDARDLRALATIDDTDPELVLERFARGDFAYVGQLGDAILCHTWFHRGPQPFSEDRYACADWALDADTFWSYNGAAAATARSSGVFVKLFQQALRELFTDHGAKRVQGFIHDTNRPSITLHERMGFQRLGTLSTVALPGVKLLRWEGDGITRHFLARRDGDFALHLPPA